MTDADRQRTISAHRAEGALGSPVIPADVEGRLTEYWGWIAAALFLLIPIDLLTTTLAIREFGISAEANPIMEWLFQHGPFAVGASHGGALLVAIAVCYGILELIGRTEDPLKGHLALVFEVWVGLLLSLGLFLAANNLSAVVFQTSLL